MNPHTGTERFQYMIYLFKKGGARVMILSKHISKLNIYFYFNTM